MKYLIYIVFVAISTISCNRTHEHSSALPQALLTNGTIYWSATTAPVAAFGNTDQAVYHQCFSNGERVLFLQFQASGHFEQLEYREESNGERVWVTVKGEVVTSTVKGKPVLTLKPQSGIYRYAKQGMVYNREIPVEDLYLQYAATFLWKTGNIPGMAGKRYLRMISISNNPAGDPGFPDPENVQVFHEAL